MDIFIVVLLLVILAILIWTVSKKPSNLDEEKLANKILLNLMQNQSENMDKILQKINTYNQFQIQILTENSQKTETTFSQLPLNLEKSFTLAKNEQQLEFEKLKSETAQNLAKIQTAIQIQLSKAVQDLVDLNTKNFNLLQKTNQEKLDQINLDVQKRLDDNFAQNLRSIQAVTENLGHIQSSAQKMIDSTKSIDKLNNIFSRTSSKAFGDFGERYLETLLTENLAEGSWEKQAKVTGSSEIIDFVVKLDGKCIGIDCKFPLTKFQDFTDAENIEKPQKLKEYLRSVKQMAGEISQKYYQNQFVEVLLMYVPTDSMYAEIVSDSNTMESLQKLKVTICAPTTIFPLILLIQRYQFKAKINHNAEAIIAGLSGIKRNILGFKDEFRKLGDKIRQAQQNFDQADKNLSGVERNIIMLEGQTDVENKLKAVEVSEMVL